MCGRYFVNEEMIRGIRRIDAGMDMRRKDVCPSQDAVVLAGKGHRLSAEIMRWGFPGSRRSGLLINARAETALEKPTFRDSLLRRRCVIPAGGFYEWNREKEKAMFYRDGAPVLYMAGFYCPFFETNRFVILTTCANASVSPVHDRMPLLLEENELEDWIFKDEFMRQVLKRIPAPLAKWHEYEQQRLDIT